MGPVQVHYPCPDLLTQTSHLWITSSRVVRNIAGFGETRNALILTFIVFSMHVEKRSPLVTQHSLNFMQNPVNVELLEGNDFKYVTI